MSLLRDLSYFLFSSFSFFPFLKWINYGKKRTNVKNVLGVQPLSRQKVLLIVLEVFVVFLPGEDQSMWVISREYKQYRDAIRIVQSSSSFITKQILNKSQYLIGVSIQHKNTILSLVQDIGYHIINFLRDRDPNHLNRRQSVVKKFVTSKSFIAGAAKESSYPCSWPNHSISYKQPKLIRKF